MGLRWCGTTTPPTERRRRCWLDELTTDPTPNVETIAKREGCSARKDNMTISLAFLAPISSRQPSKDGCLAAWELLASAICPPNGHGNTRCLASLPRKCDSRTGLCLLQSPYPGNAISRPENKARNTPLSRIHPRQRISARSKPRQLGAICCPRGNLRSRGVRGGPGRTRTSNQTVMSEAQPPDDPTKSDT